MTPEEAAAEAARIQNEQLDTTNNQVNQPVVTGTEVPPGHPTNSVPPTDNATLDLLRQLRADQQADRAERQRLEQQLHELRNPPAPKKTPEEENEEYYKNPVAVIQRKIEESLRPLQQTTQQTSRQQNMARLRGQYSNDPRFAKFWPSIGETVEQFASQTADLSDANYQAIVFAAIGAVQSGFIPSKNPEIVTGSEVPVPLEGSTSRTNVPTPPNIRSSPPAAPRTETKKKDYTELERRVMRENRMTEEQYERFMNARPGEVATIRPEAKK